jgi:hypothetical protein
MVALLVGAATGGTYSGGTGEPNDPYRIATAEDLNDIGNYEEDWDKHFILVNDVNLAEYTGTQFKIIGRTLPPYKPFTGVFDGKDHKIWNFTWSSDSIKYGIGLFAFLGEGGLIKNLGMEIVDVNAGTSSYIGGLVGYDSSGTITNCYSTGNVSGETCVGGMVGIGLNCLIIDCNSKADVTGYGSVGGLVGAIGDDEVGESTITNCYTTGNISGSLIVGGLIGDNDSGIIKNCYSKGNVSADCNVSYVGGLLGYNYSGLVRNCHSTGRVSGNFFTGGLVGYNSAKIINCYASDDVSGTGDVGGLVGSNAGTVAGSYSQSDVVLSALLLFHSAGGLVGVNGGTIRDCYSNGRVTGTGGIVAGLVGENLEDALITYSYSVGSVSGTGDVGGLLAYNAGIVIASFWDTQTSDCNTSAGGTPKTTAEMKTMSTFTNAGWDFVEIWGIGENQTYPYLRFAPAGDLNYDKRVDLFDLAILASHWLEERK